MLTRIVVVVASVVLVVLIVGAVVVFGKGSSNNSANNTPTPAAASNSNSNQLQVTDEKVGTGATAASGQKLTVSYVGALTNGTVFDSTQKDGGQPFSFQLGAGQVIKGWDEGLVGMKVGGVRKLVIPPSLGYGSQAQSSIPANSTLVFTVTLISVQ